MTMITLRVANISFNYVHHLFHKVITSINANCTTLVLLHTDRHMDGQTEERRLTQVCKEIFGHLQERL